MVSRLASALLLAVVVAACSSGSSSADQAGDLTPPPAGPADTGDLCRLLTTGDLQSVTTIAWKDGVLMPDGLPPFCQWRLGPSDIITTMDAYVDASFVSGPLDDATVSYPGADPITIGGKPGKIQGGAETAHVWLDLRGNRILRLEMAFGPNLGLDDAGVVALDERVFRRPRPPPDDAWRARRRFCPAS
jgi:hypothetical protein